MKFVRNSILFLFIVYLLACIALYLTQEKIMFFPSPLSQNYSPSNGVEVWIPVAEGVRLNAAHISYPNSKGVILYLHGNKGNVQRCIRQTSQFQDLGYDILIPDYRAYGKSEGNLENETQMYQDVQLIYDYLAKRYDKIVLLGYSMGTGMASYLAAHNPTAGLVLVAPYVSLVDMKNRYLPMIPNLLMKYKFCTNLHLQNVTCPTTLVHGTKDEVIPFDSSEELHQLFPSSKFIPLEGVDHRRIIFNPAIRSAVRDLN